jgi:hypothetical protein
MAAQGCLIPQDDVVFPNLPDQKNLPLQIKGHTPGPDREQTVIAGDKCIATSTPIGVTVFEQNVDDSTISQWYIDRTNNSGFVDGDTTFGGSTQRIISASGAVIRALGTKADGKRHTLEVFVTDGDKFVPGEVGTATKRPYGVAPDGGILADTAYVDTYLWLLQVENCPP